VWVCGCVSLDVCVSEVVCVALLRERRALLMEYRAHLMKCRSLSMEYGALLME